jgi:multiple sugar transport system permease protein
VRAIILMPWIVPTVLSAIAFWWIYDAQFSVISYLLVDVLGWRDTYINFLGEAWNARWSLIAANIWRGIPFVGDLPAGGSADHLAFALRGGAAGRRTPWQRFRHITFPMLMPDPGDRHDLLDHLHLYRLPARLRDHPRRAGQFHAPAGDAAFQRGIPGGQLGEGAASRSR